MARFASVFEPEKEALYLGRQRFRVRDVERRETAQGVVFAVRLEEIR